MEPLRFPYRPRPVRTALAGLMFAGFVVVIGHDAATNDRGLILNGIIRFDARNATVFYWVLAAACAALVLLATLAVIRSFGPPRELVLGADAVTAPAGWMGRFTQEIPYADITALEVVEVRSQRFLTIRHGGGRLSVARALLSASGDFDRLVAELERRRRVGRPDQRRSG